MNPRRKLITVLGILVVTITTGIIGYVVIEGWAFLNALYMTIITITTVGYAEVYPLSDSGRIFTIFLIIGGVGGALYALSLIIQYIIEGQFRTTLWRRRMKTRISRLKDHFIICGFGRIGEEIAHTFKEEEVSFVIIDNNPENITRAQKTGYLYIQGDATSDEMLNEAGIGKARGLIAAVGNDTDNTYITLSARELNHELFIEARASSRAAETKLKRAGADRVVSPNSIGARRMSLLALHPSVADFIDTVVPRRGRELQMENVIVNNNSVFVGQTVEETRYRTKTTILAISKKDGKLFANPRGEETIGAGDHLIAMGTKKQLAILEKICEECKTDE